MFDWKEFIEKNLINSNKSLYHFVGIRFIFEKRFSGVFDKIISETSFLLDDTFVKERLYYLYHHIYERKMCDCCKTNFAKFIDFKNGFRQACSKECYKKLMQIVQKNGKTFAVNKSIKSADTLKKTPLKSILKSKRIHETKSRLKTDVKFKEQRIEENQRKIERAQERSRRRQLLKSSKIRSVNFSREEYLKTVDKKRTLSVLEIDKNGLNGYERGATGKVKCPVKRYNEDLHYQGSFEKKFLDFVNVLGLIKFIKNGPTFYYQIEGKQACYKSDFVCSNSIFETKSIWSYDNRGKNIKLRLKTNLKVIAALKSGYDYFLVIDDHFLKVILNDLQDIQTDLVKKMQYFSKEILEEILEDCLNKDQEMLQNVKI